MSQDIDELKQQVMDLQNQLAFQEDALRSLDEAMGVQQQEIILLKRLVELLQLRLKEQAGLAEAVEGGAPADEKPPHY